MLGSPSFGGTKNGLTHDALFLSNQAPLHAINPRFVQQYNGRSYSLLSIIEIFRV